MKIFFTLAISLCFKLSHCCWMLVYSPVTLSQLPVSPLGTRDWPLVACAVHYVQRVNRERSTCIFDRNENHAVWIFWIPWYTMILPKPNGVLVILITCEIIHSDFYSLFPLVPWQLRVTVWSLCTKAVSYIKYPKACQKGQYENDIVPFIFLWLMSVYVLRGAPEGRASGPSASACLMNHMLVFTLCSDPGYEAKLWSSADSCAPLQ